MFAQRGIGSLAMAAAAAIVALAVLSAPAQAAKRVALVIGNAVYQHAPQLANPLNDAGNIGAALGRLGFEVTKLENAGKVALERGLLHFSRAASTAEVAVVFYAGHGIEVDKRNFLVPVDARLLSDREVEFETVSLDLVGRAVEGASGLGLVILDACRDNPFAASMRRAGAKRSIGRGLARVEPSGEMLVAYAAKEGTLASDGTGRNSPYTRALLAHLEEPGLEVGLMFRKVRDAVLEATGNKQEPFVYGSLSSKGAYLGARPEPPAPAIPGKTVTPKGAPPTGGLTREQIAARRVVAEKELLFWQSVKDSADPAEIGAYLAQYPSGTFAALARTRLKRLTDARDKISAEQSEAAHELKPADRRKIQTALWALGFNPGVPDGVFGERTRDAIRDWQRSRSQPATGFLDAASARTLRTAAPDLSRPLWLTAQNQPCKVWNPNPKPGETVTWSGGCIDGQASGSGRLVWRGSYGQDTYVGQYQGGKRHGRGIFKWFSGARYEGEWRNGRRNGRGTEAWSDGSRYVGDYKNGKPHGYGTYTASDGRVFQGIWSYGCFGERYGQWATIGTTAESCGFK